MLKGVISHMATARHRLGTAYKAENAPAFSASLCALAQYQIQSHRRRRRQIQSNFISKQTFVYVAAVAMVEDDIR